jgi:hypothetical protein
VLRRQRVKTQLGLGEKQFIGDAEAQKLLMDMRHFGAWKLG